MRLRTLNRPAQIRGVGLHTGHATTVRLLPRETSGWVFRRTDLPDEPEFEADTTSVRNDAWMTTIGGNHGLLHCCEHILAALMAMQVHACTIEVDADELPIGDGSALPFVDAIRDAGIAELNSRSHSCAVMRACWVHEGDKHVFAFPCERLRVSCAVDYQHPLAGAQVFSTEVTPDIFSEQIAPARTFALAEWIDDLRREGLIRGGSLDNAVVVFPDHYSSPLRFPDELARHKALDLIGDLALVGKPITGHFIAIKASHALHIQLVKRLKSSDCLMES